MDQSVNPLAIRFDVAMQVPGAGLRRRHVLLLFGHDAGRGGHPGPLQQDGAALPGAADRQLCAVAAAAAAPGAVPAPPPAPPRTGRGWHPAATTQVSFQLIRADFFFFFCNLKISLACSVLLGSNQIDQGKNIDEYIRSNTV